MTPNYRTKSFPVFAKKLRQEDIDVMEHPSKRFVSPGQWAVKHVNGTSSYITFMSDAEFHFHYEEIPTYEAL